MIIKSIYPPVSIPKNENVGRFLLRAIDEWSRDPGKVALINGPTNDQITYGDVAEMSRALSSSLVGLGVQRGDVICFVAPNCAEYIIAMLGALHIGAIITGANPAFTPDELRHQITDSGATHLLSTVNLLSKVKEIQNTCKQLKNVILIGQKDSIEGYSSFASLVSPSCAVREVPFSGSGADTAMLPYSSGTTGLPKGVIITHTNLIARMKTYGSEGLSFYSTDGSEIAIAVFPLYHIAGTCSSALHALYSGVKNILYPAFDYETYLKANEKYKSTRLAVPPPVIIRLAKDTSVDQYDLSSVHTIYCSASPVPPAMMLGAAHRLNVRYVTVGYGLTECTGACHFTRDGLAKPSSAGKAGPNAEFKILDVKTRQVLGVGEDGEIVLRSPTVSPGYHNKPEATRATIDDQGWLYTGDIGHFDADGDLYIVDRLKELIKYKGYQVAPAELEALLLTNVHVSDAAVIGVPDEECGELPRAYVVLKEGHNVIPEEIQDFVKAKVAPYKRLRGGVIVAPSIPKSASGKILRRLLRDQAKKNLVHKL